ncbi:mannose-6-phosphate isomerase-like [Paramacrobiotus metropolitanus]|uniref:mannose-6-phosphate isomerase-like n=1 Tax=Paramacrobiotus metropolitanus TaxID=2943436 RepID=UPI002446496B|nr:mannose-6-phosphate isomerase-like [Paramacrobiotus metropolitanus]
MSESIKSKFFGAVKDVREKVKELMIDSTSPGPSPRPSPKPSPKPSPRASPAVKIMDDEIKALRLICSIQQYDWGKVGRSSIVAQLAEAGATDEKIDEGKPYAELWMGTHPKGPCYILLPNNQGHLLGDYLQKNDYLIGDALSQQFGTDGLPFLFKVLSVDKALSIQIHPDKDEAGVLHRRDGKNYPDANHKPEMAIALTPFQALIGFRPLAEILVFIRTIPELRSVIGEETCILVEKGLTSPLQDDQVNALKKAFSSLMEADKGLVADEGQKLNRYFMNLRVDHANQAGTRSGGVFQDHGHIYIQLYADFPGDVGCFCVFFMNHITLQPGEAIFLGPDVPHAYLKGDLVECMANSDNVVRAGLTPKFRDVETLLELVDYSYGPGEDYKFPLTHDNDDVWTAYYLPPIAEFGVARTEIPEANAIYTLPELGSASIVLCLTGSARCSIAEEPIEKGTVWLLPANTEAEIRITEGPIVLFRAFAQV